MAFVEFGLWCIVALIVFVFVSIGFFALTGKSLLWRQMEFQHYNKLDPLKIAIIDARKLGLPLLDEVVEATIKHTHPTILPIDDILDPEDCMTFFSIL